MRSWTNLKQTATLNLSLPAIAEIYNPQSQYRRRHRRHPSPGSSPIPSRKRPKTGQPAPAQALRCIYATGGRGKDELCRRAPKAERAAAGQAFAVAETHASAKNPQQVVIELQRLNF